MAIGFAFRDILENFLSGIILLLTEPFRINDQIVVGDFEGTVEDIQIRATAIRTYNNRRVVIPNPQVFTNPVIVNTAFQRRRIDFEFTIGTSDDVPAAKAAIVHAISGIKGILEFPGRTSLSASWATTGSCSRRAGGSLPHARPTPWTPATGCCSPSATPCSVEDRPALSDTPDPLPRSDGRNRWRSGPAARRLARWSRPRPHAA